MQCAHLVVAEWGHGWHWEYNNTQFKPAKALKVERNAFSGGLIAIEWQALFLEHAALASTRCNSVSLAGNHDTPPCYRLRAPFFGSTSNGLQAIFWVEGSQPVWTVHALKYGTESDWSGSLCDFDDTDAALMATNTHEQFRNAASTLVDHTYNNWQHRQLSPNAVAANSAGCSHMLAHMFASVSAAAWMKTRIAADVLQLYALIVNYVNADVIEPLRNTFGTVFSFVTGNWARISSIFESYIEVFAWLGIAVAVAVVFLVLIGHIQSLQVKEHLQGREADSWNDLKKV